MNLCLIGQNEDKLNKIASHMKQITKRRGFQVITIVNDFSKSDLDLNLNFQNELELQLCKMVAQYRATGRGGIGVLVNCMNYRNEIPCIYHEHKLDDVEDMMKTNVEGTLTVVDTVLPYLIQQGKMNMSLSMNSMRTRMGMGTRAKAASPSAIITVGSHASHHPTPMMSVYSATNAYRNAYVKQYYGYDNDDDDECKSKYKALGIEFLSVTPELMSSNMPRKRQNAAFVRSPSADRIVSAALRNLGYQSEYFSWLGHAQTTIIPHIMWIHPWHRFLNKMKVARLEMLRSRRM